MSHIRMAIGKHKWIKHTFFLLIGLVIFILLIRYGGTESLKQFTDLKFIPSIGIIITTLIITGSVAIRWQNITNTLLNSTIARSFQFYYFFIISRVSGFILPKDLTDFGLRILWLKKIKKIPLSVAGSSVAIDRIFDLMILIIFFIGSLPFWFGLNNLYLALSIIALFPIIIGITLLFIHKSFLTGIENIFSFGLKIGLKLPVIKKKIPQELPFSFQDKKVLRTVYFLSFLKFLSTIARFVLFALALNIPISPELIIIGAPLGQLSYLIAFTPGGLGIMEAGWLGVLKLLHVQTDIAIDFVVGQRILTIGVILILALISHLIKTFTEIKTS